LQIESASHARQFFVGGNVLDFELLVTGGNVENSTAWFVALRQVD
jgi:hypothetical protein